MKFYKICLGEERIADDGYIAKPISTSYIINSEIYDVYAFLKDGELKELVTGLLLKEYSMAGYDDLGYYRKEEVDKNEVAKFIRCLKDNNTLSMYKDKILNTFNNQKNSREDLETIDLFYNDEKVISNFLRR